MKNKGSQKRIKKSVTQKKYKNKKRTTQNNKKKRIITSGEPETNDKENMIKTSSKIQTNNSVMNDDCCMCMQPIDDKYFHPSKCIQKYGSRAHRICADCWWGEFAKEGSTHECPGCIKNIPLSKKQPKSKTKEETYIDLLDE